MMRQLIRNVFPLFCSIFIFSSCSFFKPNELVQKEVFIKKTILSPQQTKLVLDQFKTAYNQSEISVALMKGGEVNYFGVKRENDSLSFVENRNSIFEIGSITKVFTATILAKTVLEKPVTLDDKVEDYIGFDINVSVPFSFKELSNHTSGLPRLPSNMGFFEKDPLNPYVDYDGEKLREYLTGEVALNANPRVHFQYSNLGVGILGFTLSKIHQSSYETLLEEFIFDPLFMTSSTSDLSKVKGTLVKGYDELGIKTKNWEFDAMSGAGSILSSTSDLSKFALAQINISDSSIALTQKPTFKISDTRSVGLGWFLLKKSDELGELLWHNGGTGGYSSSMMISRKQKTAVVILSNNQTMDLDFLSYEFLKGL